MFLEFVNQNIWWFVALVVVFNLLLWSILQSSVPGANTVSALEMPGLQRKGKSIIVDVSKTDEFARAHIPKSVNYPLEDLDTKDKTLQKFKDSTVILVCQTGTRSAKAAKKLLASGFSNVNLIRGGLASWNKENLPLDSIKK